MLCIRPTRMFAPDPLSSFVHCQFHCEDPFGKFYRGGGFGFFELQDNALACFSITCASYTSIRVSVFLFVASHVGLADWSRQQAGAHRDRATLLILQPPAPTKVCCVHRLKLPSTETVLDLSSLSPLGLGKICILN